jgi:hypothetical protein
MKTLEQELIPPEISNECTPIIQKIPPKLLTTAKKNQLKFSQSAPGHQQLKTVNQRIICKKKCNSPFCSALLIYVAETADKPRHLLKKII